MKKLVILTLFFFLISCSYKETWNLPFDKAIEAQLEANNHNTIDFSAIGDETWARVCFLGPYNENSADILGFSWDVADHTRVLQSDGHNVIIFATETEVMEFVVEPRNQVDFAELSGQCLARDESRLVRDASDQAWLIEP